MSSPKAAAPSPKSPKSPKSPSKSPQSPPAGPFQGASPPAQEAVVQPAGVIEVDDDDGASSVSGLTDITDTTSLRSSILHYKWENGRRYHAYQDGSYWGPNDDRQQEVEDLFHELFKIILDGKLHAIPDLEDPQNVLDVGCGTGAWAVDFADENPGAKVTGVDLSAIQPAFVPPNCQFEIDDFNQPWTFPVESFDFIHVRVMSGCLNDWVAFYREAFAHLKPGGWLQHIEISSSMKCDDETMQPNSPFAEWAAVFKQMSAASGKSFQVCEQARGWLEEAGGFVNVRETVVKLPVGTWARDKKLKHLGAWNRQFMLDGAEGFCLRALTGALGWSYEKAQVFLAEIRKELKDPNLHCYSEMRIVYAQKPLE